MQFFQKFIKCTQTAFHGPVLITNNLPQVGPLIVKAVATPQLEVHDTSTPTIYIDEHLDSSTLACYSALPTFNGSTLLPSSSLLYNASFFPQDNSSSLTVLTPVLFPVSCFPPIISSECYGPENAIFGLYLEDDDFSYELVGAMFDASVSEISWPELDLVSLGAR